MCDDDDGWKEFFEAESNGEFDSTNLDKLKQSLEEANKAKDIGRAKAMQLAIQMWREINNNTYVQED